MYFGGVSRKEMKRDESKMRDHSIRTGGLELDEMSRLSKDFIQWLELMLLDFGPMQRDTSCFPP